MNRLSVNMKVIHIESGLGNQMLSYCEYLAAKNANPDDKVYIETIIYEIPEAYNVICQWNGYELKRIFNIEVPNIKELFSDEQWKCIIQDIRDSKFWERNWNYPVIFTAVLRKYGLNLKNIRGDFESPGWPEMVVPSKITLKRAIKIKLEKFLPYIYIRTYAQKLRKRNNKDDYSKSLFVSTKDNFFSGQRLTFKLKRSGIERIQEEIRRSFVFPKFTDSRNQEELHIIKNCNSVAIHARRGDMLGYNYAYYATGYFKKSVNYIRKNTKDPVFFIFCDPESIEWAKNNATILGLNFKEDEIHFVDWNKSTDSYRDMQLMAACKHQIITNSSFGWWGAWLNDNPTKITCSPDILINTTHNF